LLLLKKGTIISPREHGDEVWAVDKKEKDIDTALLTFHTLNASQQIQSKSKDTGQRTKSLKKSAAFSFWTPQNTRPLFTIYREKKG